MSLSVTLTVRSAWAPTPSVTAPPKSTPTCPPVLALYSYVRSDQLEYGFSAGLPLKHRFVSG